MKAGDMVIVATEGGKPGIVRHVCRDGYVAVRLLNERGLWHEWPAAMVRPATPAECVGAATKFLPLTRW